MKYLASVAIFIAFGISISFIAWAGGWNFERGESGSVVASLIIFVGAYLASFPIAFKWFKQKDKQ